MKRRCFRLAALLCVAALTLSGCMGARSPDEYGYALVLGIDVGKTKPFYISMLLQRGNGSAQNSQNNLCTLVGVECTDLFEAVELLEGGLPYSLSMARVTAIAFGAEVARGELLERFLSASLGSLHIRYYANLIAVSGRAEDYLQGLRSELNPNVAKLQYNFIEYKEETGMVPAITLAQFYDSAWNQTGDVVLPLGGYEKKQSGGEDAGGKDTQQTSSGRPQNTPAPSGASQSPEPSSAPKTSDAQGSFDYLPGQTEREGGLPAGMIGAALFHGTRLKGFLNGPHTQLLLMGRGEFHRGRIQLTMGGEPVSVLLTAKGTPKVKLTLGGAPGAEISLSLYASVEQPAAASGIDKQELRRAIADYVQTGMATVFSACQVLGCDSFNLGGQAVTQFHDAKAWEAFDFNAIYKKMKASFDVSIFLKYNPTGSRVE